MKTPRQIVTMTPDCYREIRESIGLSQRALAKWLGVDVSTISKRESGKRGINSEAEFAIRYFAKDNPLIKPAIKRAIREKLRSHDYGLVHD